MAVCLQVTIGNGAEEVHVPAYDAWDGLSLEYDLNWPLHILLTPEVSLVSPNTLIAAWRLLRLQEP